MHCPDKEHNVKKKQTKRINSKTQKIQEQCTIKLRNRFEILSTKMTRKTVFVAAASITVVCCRIDDDDGKVGVRL